MAWQRASGYNKRADVESQMARWKGILGEALRFHCDAAQATKEPLASRSSTACSTLGARTLSVSSDYQRGLGQSLAQLALMGWTPPVSGE